MEVISYIIGEEMGIDVPKSYPAIFAVDNGEVFCGSITEWFYNVRTEVFTHARDYFIRLYDDFDNEKGEQHNLIDIRKILRFMVAFSKSDVDWNKWVYDMILFDTLIGNTDRHQENWGITTSSIKNESGAFDFTMRISPFFDNGTSLGIERFPNKVSSWNVNRLFDYIKNGNHHAKLTIKSTNRLGHLDSIMILSQTDKNAKNYFSMKMADFNFERTFGKIRMLCDIECPVPLSKERVDWIERLLSLRFACICRIIEND